MNREPYTPAQVLANLQSFLSILESEAMTKLDLEWIKWVCNDIIERGVDVSSASDFEELWQDAERRAEQLRRQLFCTVKLLDKKRDEATRLRKTMNDYRKALEKK